MKNQYKYISLFSGAMGLDLGLEKAGWVTQLALDNFKAACETIRNNREKLINPDLSIIEDDIRNYSSRDLLKLSNIKKKELLALFVLEIIN